MICFSRNTGFIVGSGRLCQFYGKDRSKPKRKLEFRLVFENKSFVRLILSRGESRRMAINSTVKSNEAAMILTSGASGRVNALLSRRSLKVLKSLLMLVNAFILVLVLPFRGRRRYISASSPAIMSSASCSGPEKGGGRGEKEEVAGAGGGSAHQKGQVSGDRRKGGPVVRVPTTIVPWKSSAAAAVDPEVAARRALAIQRVMQDDNDGTTVREFSLFVTPRGATMFTQSWTPISIKIKGLVFLLHGLNEHSGRYNKFAKELNANGYKVYGMDWIGHGGSDGLHAFVPSLDDAVSDMKSFLWKFLAENPGLPCFCFGHSTGAAIILKAALDPNVEASVSGIVLTSPAVGVQPSHPIFVILAPVFAALLPRYQFAAANKQGITVSRDPDALVAKYSDPLVYTGSIRVRTGYEILRISSYLQQNLSRLKVPFLVLHGTADAVTDPATSLKLYEEASSNDKTINLYDGLLHDLLFEPEREEIVKAIIKWLNCRV